MRIDLPNDQWAELRDPQAVTERQRRPIARALRGVRPEIQERSRAAAELPDLDDGKPGAEKQDALQRLQFLMTNEEADAYQTAGDAAAVARPAPTGGSNASATLSTDGHLATSLTSGATSDSSD